MRGTSCLVVSIRDHAFFEHTVLEGEIGDGLLERSRLNPKVFDLGARCLTCGIARQAALAGLKELLRPAVLQARHDALTAAEFSDTLLAAQTLKHDPDLLFSGMLLPRSTADVLDDPTRQKTWTFRVSVSSPLLGGYDEPETLR
jgi:hypothetical protein